VSVTVPPPFYSYQHAYPWLLHSFPTRRSSDLHDQGSSRAPRRPSASRLEGKAVPVRRWVVRLTERGDRVVHGGGAGEGPQERVLDIGRGDGGQLAPRTGAVLQARLEHLVLVARPPLAAGGAVSRVLVGDDDVRGTVQAAAHRAVGAHLVTAEVVDAVSVVADAGQLAWVVDRHGGGIALGRTHSDHLEVHGEQLLGRRRQVWARR